MMQFGYEDVADRIIGMPFASFCIFLACLRSFLNNFAAAANALLRMLLQVLLKIMLRMLPRMLLRMLSWMLLRMLGMILQRLLRMLVLRL